MPIVMKRVAIYIIFLFSMQKLAAQDMVVSSYFVGADVRDSWIELLVTADNLDIRQWLLGDYSPNGGGHLSNYESIKFRQISYWTHLRKGTIILIYCRSVNSSNIAYPSDLSKDDGFIALNAQNATYFEDCPATSDAKLDLDALADMVTIKYSSEIHSLGHGTNHSNWTLVSNPKVINAQAGVNNRLIQVTPGSTLPEYDNVIEDTVRTNMTATTLTQGLPNIRSGWLNANSNFWRTCREPLWSSPALSISTNTLRTADTLVWSLMTDPYPNDSLQGYLILSCGSNNFTNPTDGVTYQVGDPIGSAQVVGIVNYSQLNRFVNTHPAECNRTYYRVYAFRFKTDEPNGNNYHLARGRAYNQAFYASGNSARANPIPILFHY